MISQIPKQYYVAFNLLVLATAIYIGVDIFYRIVRMQLWQVDTREVAMVHDTGLPELSDGREDSRRAIVDRNLFGSEEAKQSEIRAEEIKNLEPTSLQVSLLGTIAGDEQSARAIIEDKKTRVQNLYRTGDNIEGAVIKKILRGKVVLRIDGRDEILTMEEGMAAESGSERETEKAVSQVSRRPSAAVTNRKIVTLSRQDIQGALENINDILSQIRVQPYMKDGASEGLVISDIGPESIFQKMGLNDGDIVQGVNNKRIKSPEDVIALYQSLKFGSRINLQVVRDGQRKVLNYNIR